MQPLTSKATIAARGVREVFIFMLSYPFGGSTASRRTTWQS
jgi:hypothetical protein